MKRFGIVLALAALAGCTGQTPVRGTGAPPPAASSFRLKPGDKVRIATYGQEALTGEFQVSPAGAVAFPLIGQVNAAGLEPVELSRLIQGRLADGYLLSPQVSVEVASYQPIYILGEVKKPGEYPFTQGLTIRGAVAKADGFTYRANEKRVFLKRAGEAGETVYPLTADFPVLPGDTIRFAERYF